MARPGSSALTHAVLLLGLLVGSAHADDLVDRMEALAADHPRVARVQTLGYSVGGRPLRALILAVGERPLEDRLGLLAVAGLDGRRHGDGELLLAVARSWLEDEDGLAGRLGERALVLVPAADPEGAAASAGELGPARELAGNRRADDADRDGRVDEDGPDDLDGDGLITWMAVPDGAGTWVFDEHDGRALRKARDDERGTHRLLREGLDDDGDGAFGEDGDEGVLIDRNFAHGFVEHTASGGAYPLSEPETRALADFLLDHPGLGSVLVVGADDTLVHTPAAAGKVDRGGWRGGFLAALDGLLEADVETMKVFHELLQDAAEGDHEVEGEGPADGSLLAWAYHQAGRWPLGLVVWSPPEDFPEAADEAEAEAGDEAADEQAAGDEMAGDEAAVDDGDEPAAAMADDDGDDDGDDGSADAPSDEAEAGDDVAADDEDERASDPDSPVPAAVLAWLDAEQQGAGFVPWAPFEHPDLGTVQIGGLLPGLLVDPPAEAVEALSGRLAAFLLAVLDAGPTLAFEDVELTAHGEGLVTLEATLVNTGRLPTAPRFAADASIARPLRVSLDLPAGVRRVAGPAEVLVDRLDGLGGRRELRWVLAGASPGGTLTVLVDTDTASDLSLELTLP